MSYGISGKNTTWWKIKVFPAQAKGDNLREESQNSIRLERRRAQFNRLPHFGKPRAFVFCCFWRIQESVLSPCERSGFYLGFLWEEDMYGAENMWGTSENMTAQLFFSDVVVFLQFPNTPLSKICSTQDCLGGVSGAAWVSQAPEYWNDSTTTRHMRLSRC